MGSLPDGGSASLTIQFRALDPRSFAQTMIWTPQDSRQSLPALLALLPHTAQVLLPSGFSATVLPALVDQALASQLHLQPGAVFSLSLNDLTDATLNYQVAAVVEHMPTVNSSATASLSGSPGGVLVDYQQFVATYDASFLDQERKALANSQTGGPTQLSPPPAVDFNHLWLRTSADPHSLAALRSTLSTSSLALSNLYDRRTIMAELQHDPFHLNILLILDIGAVTAFLGNLISSWLSVRSRRTSFVVLLALGLTSHQVAGILLWEQGFISTAALLLGVAFGILLTKVAGPVLIFTGQPEHGPLSNLSIPDLYLLQRALPAQIITPFSLDLTFVALVALCALALATMIRAALHPSISTELRLNED